MRRRWRRSGNGGSRTSLAADATARRGGWPDPLAAAAALAEGIAARAEEIEAARRLPPDLAEALCAEGLMHLFLPAACGGPQASPAAGLSAIRRLAQADGATGWCAMIASTSALTAAWLPPRVARAVYLRERTGPPPIVGGVYAPLGRAVPEGAGFRLDGRWGWASNSANCRWLLAGALVAGSEAGAHPEMRLFLVPAEAAILIDTWHASGLCGTGSGDMAVEGLFVPAERVIDLVGGRAQVDAPLYGFPVFGLLALGVAAVALGIARAALDDTIALAVAKRPQGGRRTLAERAHVQAELATCEGQWRAAIALVDAVVAEAWEMACGGIALPLAQRAGLRLAAVQATGTAAQVTGRAYALAGGSAVFRSHPLQRRFRDVHTATQHVMVAQPVLESVGRVLLGQKVNAAEL